MESKNTRERRTAIITGAGTGIGRATAELLGADGWNIGLVGRRRNVLEKAAAELPGSTSTFVGDLAEPEDVDRVAAEVGEQIGVVDALVLNAGGIERQPSDDTIGVAEYWTANFRGNVLPAVLPVHALKPYIRRNGGRIVVMSSAAARSGGGDPAYASVKAALNRWITSLASELGPLGITANVLSPGFVPNTELYGAEGPDPTWHDEIVKGISIGRVGTPSDIAHAVRYLLSEQAGFTSGSIMDVNGGVRRRT